MCVWDHDRPLTLSETLIFSVKCQSYRVFAQRAAWVISNPPWPHLIHLCFIYLQKTPQTQRETSSEVITLPWWGLWECLVWSDLNFLIPAEIVGIDWLSIRILTGLRKSKAQSWSCSHRHHTVLFPRVQWMRNTRVNESNQPIRMSHWSNSPIWLAKGRIRNLRVE